MPSNIITRTMNGYSRHQCSYCGELVQISQHIPLKVDAGIPITKKDAERICRGAQEKLGKKEARTAAKITTLSNPADYYKLPLNGWCPRCHRQESWGKSPIKWLNVLSTVGLVLLVICGAVAVLTKETRPPNIRFWLWLGATVFLFLFKLMRDQNIKNQIAKLPPESLPKITLVDSSDTVEHFFY